MAIATSGGPRTIGDAELTQLPKDGRKRELVDGEVRVSPAGGWHGQVTVRLLLRLGTFIAREMGGVLLDSSTGFRLPGGNVRSPDLSYVAPGRLPDDRAPKGFVEVVPDLAVEVLSPEDNARDVLDKVGEYLQAGVRLVWVIDPDSRRAAAHRSLTEVSEIDPDGSLDGEDVLPGFRAELASLLE